MAFLLALSWLVIGRITGTAYFDGRGSLSLVIRPILLIDGLHVSGAGTLC